MAMNTSRIVSAAMSDLQSRGFHPEKVPFLDTGKSALEHIVEAVSVAVVNEITTNAELFQATGAAGVPVQVVVTTGTGATTGPVTVTGKVR
jgi:hypothetical protein